MRLFVGIPVPAEIANDLSSAADKLPVGFRRSSPEDMHITLEFLGEVSEQQLPCVATELGSISCRPFEVIIAGTGMFPGVVFADLKPSPELNALATLVMARMTRCGFPAENRPYRPHITLARTRQRSPLWAYPEISPHRFVAAHFVLYRSHSGITGARYERLKTFRMTLP